MSLKLGNLWVFVVLASMLAPVHSAPVAATPAPPAAELPSGSMESAPIEEVIEASDAGFRFDAFIVRWHGARVLVSDPIGVCRLGVGDRIRFMVARSGDVGGRHVLGFISLERPEGQPSAASAPAPSFAGQSATAIVEEVLSVTDGDYRFAAYLVQWQGQRVAVTDLSGGEQHALPGASIPIMAARLSVMGHQVLQFISPQAGAASAAASPAAAANAAHDVGLIDEVLKGTFSGDSYAAYIVSWHGSQIALDPARLAPLQQAGETALLRVRRVELPFGAGKGTLVFAADTPEDSAPAAEPDASATGSMVEGVVERVLQAQADDYRYRAYLVRWSGSRVLVNDLFATTNYQGGDRITFMMGHGASAGERRVFFLLIDPKAAMPAKTDASH